MKIYDIDVNIENLSKSEKKIANFFCKNIRQIPSLTLTDLAEKIEVSTATISRFCKSIDFAGFKEFKNYLKESLKITPAHKMESILNEIDSNEIAPKILNKSVNHLQNTASRIANDQFKQAVNTLINADNIYLFAPGPSAGVAELLTYRLRRFQLDINQMATSGKQLIESLVNLTGEDVVVIFGFFNFSPATRVILDQAQEVSFSTILITDLVVSEMIDKSDIVLYTERGDLWEFHSMVAPIALVEALVVGVAMHDEEKYLDKLNNIQQLREKYSKYLP